MGKRLAKAEPTWADVKISLASFDRAALLGVLQDLYAADEANRAFLHARFGLGEDLLQAYKKTIDRWLCPDVFRGQQTSVSRAKGAIARYKKALGDPVSLAELLVFYCERAAGFCREVDHRDTAYLDALVRTFEEALKATGNLTGKLQNGFLARLESVRSMVVNSVMELARTWMFCFQSSIYPFTLGVLIEVGRFCLTSDHSEPCLGLENQHADRPSWISPG